MVLATLMNQAQNTVGQKSTSALTTEWFVLLLFTAFHLYGIGVFQIGEFSLAIWDVLIIIFLIFYLIFIYLNNYNLFNQNISRMLLFLSVILTIWITFCALLSPLPDRAFTMVVLQLLNISVLSILVVSDRLNLRSLNSRILWIGAGLAVIAIGLYLSALPRYTEIVAKPALWHSPIGYVLDQGGVLRLIGLAKDPNFYSLWMTLPLIGGLIRGRFALLLWLPIALSVGMALSRSFFIALFVASLILAPISWCNRSLRSSFNRLVTIPSLMVLTTLCASLLWTNIEYISKRIALAEQTPRFERWEILSGRMTEQWNPILGAGLRSAEMLLGGKYSHSTYLDALFETGIVGFTLWITILILSTIICFLNIKFSEGEYLPWAYTWIVLLVMFLSFSLLYHPFVWMVMGVLANGLNIRKPCSTGISNRSLVGSLIRR